MTDLLELLALELWRGEHDLAVSGVVADVIKVGVPLVAGILHGTRVKSGHTEIKKTRILEFSIWLPRKEARLCGLLTPGSV